jgi:hypothetical protein
MAVKPKQKQQFKNTQGRYLSRGMFIEFRGDIERLDREGGNELYTLADEDFESYPSLKRLYLEAEDPAEYDFANQHLAGWVHWKELCQYNWFKPYLSQWREELTMRLKSKANARLKAIAEDPTSKNFYNANRYIASEGYEATVADTKRSNAGRKSKESIEIKANELLVRANEYKDDISTDFKRILS